jgi:hypothetical protein
VKKINDMHSEIQELRETTKHREEERPLMHEGLLDTARDQLREFEGKYEELLHLYRRGEEKNKRDERESKAVKERAREL